MKVPLLLNEEKAYENGRSKDSVNDIKLFS